MASNTPNLGLLKKDPMTDGNETFNIETMLNENWDKIDTAVGSCEAEITDLKQSGVDGKNRLETAIIAKEGTVSKQRQVATFEELDNGIRSIPTGTDTSDATAAAGDILASKTAYGPNGKITGTIPNLTGIRTATGTAKWPDGALAVYPEKGYQKGGAGDGEIKVTTAQLQEAEPNLNSANILSGHSIFGVSGGIANRSVENNHMPGLEKTAWTGDRYFIRPPAGYYNGSTWVTAPEPNLRPENIREGVIVGGITGTLQPRIYNRQVVQLPGRTASIEAGQDYYNLVLDLGYVSGVVICYSINGGGGNPDYSQAIRAQTWGTLSYGASMNYKILTDIVIRNSLGQTIVLARDDERDGAYVRTNASTSILNFILDIPNAVIESHYYSDNKVTWDQIRILDYFDFTKPMGIYTRHRVNSTYASEFESITMNYYANAIVTVT